MANDRPSEGPILRRLCTPPHETVIFHVDFALHPEFRFWAQKCTLPHETVFFLKFGPPKSYFFAFSDRKFQNSPRISDAQTTDFRLEFGASKQVFCPRICDLERFWGVCQESVIWSDFGGFALGSVIWSDFGGFALGSVIWSDFGGFALGSVIWSDFGDLAWISDSDLGGLAWISDSGFGGLAWITDSDFGSAWPYTDLVSAG